MTQEQLTQLAQTLNLSLEATSRMLETEKKRILAGERYRKSEAYKIRLEQQKLVRLAMKGI